MYIGSSLRMLLRLVVKRLCSHSTGYTKPSRAPNMVSDKVRVGLMPLTANQIRPPAVMLEMIITAQNSSAVSM